MPKTALPPLRTTVGVVVAAEAVVTPKAAMLPRTMAPTAMPDIIRFILYCLLFSLELLDFETAGERRGEGVAFA